MIRRVEAPQGFSFLNPYRTYAQSKLPDNAVSLWADYETTFAMDPEDGCYRPVVKITLVFLQIFTHYAEIFDPSVDKDPAMLEEIRRWERVLESDCELMSEIGNEQQERG